MPVRKDIVELNPEKWYASHSTYICNGPFKLSYWKRKYNMEFEKNNNYYNNERIKLDRLTFRMLEEPSTYLSAWEIGDIDIIESPPSSEVYRLRSKNELHTSPYAAAYFYIFNVNEKPLDDRNVRKALAYAVDRFSIIQDVIKNEAIPAGGFIPNGIPDVDISKDFRNTGGAYLKAEANVQKARELMADAGYPEGNGFPEISVIYNDTGSHGAIARALGDMWKRNLGITVKLYAMDWRTMQNLRANGSYHMARQGWVADYIDPMAFMNLFVSGGGNNNSGYSNPVYDELIDRAKIEKDPAVRMNYLHDAETILMDDMPVLPLYFYNNLICSKPHIKGVRKSPLGVIYFDEAYVDYK